MTTVQSHAPVIFLNLFAGSGSDRVVDLIRSSVVAQALGATKVATVGQLGWPTDASALQLLEHPMSREDWSRRSGPGDVSIVVTRDPRDLVAGFARAGAAHHRGLSDQELLLTGMARLKDQERMLRSWAGRSGSSTELIAAYEDVATDPAAFLSDLAAFVGLPGLSPTRPGLFGDDAEVLDLRRDRGDGVGVWRNTFDAEMAETFEHLFPGLVVELCLDDRSWTDWTDWSEVIVDLGGQVDDRATPVRRDLFAGARTER